MKNGEQGAGVWDIAVSAIDVDETNVRSRMAGIDELAASIRTHGIIQPLVASGGADGRIKLIAGHRRLAAAKLAGLARVPVVMRDEEGSVAKELQLVENVQREDLPALDVADALQTMVAGGKTADEIAERVGKSAAWVRRHLALLKLDGKVLDAIRKQGLRFTQAEHVAKVLKNGSLAEALDTTKALGSGQLSRRAAERALPKEGEVATHKQSLSAKGAHYHAALSVESDIPIDSIRARQLGELMTALDRIMMGEAA